MSGRTQKEALLTLLLRKVISEKSTGRRAEEIKLKKSRNKTFANMAFSQRLRSFKQPIYSVPSLLDARIFHPPSQSIFAGNQGKKSLILTKNNPRYLHSLSVNVKFTGSISYVERPKSTMYNKQFSTTYPNLDTEPKQTDKEEKPGTENDDGSLDDKPLTQRQKLSRTFAAYGTAALVFHTTISLSSLGTCYMIVSR